MSVPPPLRLHTRGRATRAAFTVALLGALAYGSIWGRDPVFPVGPMSQYARYVPPDGTVQSTTVWADTTAGTYVNVELDAHGVGVKRADVEAQLGQIIANPSLLRTISSAQRRLHPHQPQFVRLYVVQATIQLHNRVPDGRTVRTLATWDVSP